MLDDIRGKRILITGSSTGIGAAAAQEFARLGAKVAVHGSKSVAAAEKIVQTIEENGGEASLVVGDVTDTAIATQIVTEATTALGGLDVLINNAGSLIRRLSNAEFENELYDQIYDLNVRSIFNVTKAALPHLKASNAASIINTGSIAGRNGGAAGSVIYASAKSAVHSISRNQAREFAADQIRVNTVAPGFIETPFHAETPEPARQGALSAIVMGRLGTAQECVGAYVFLASENMAGYITGQIIDVNGGQLMP